MVKALTGSDPLTARFMRRVLRFRSAVQVAHCRQQPAGIVRRRSRHKAAHRALCLFNVIFKNPDLDLPERLKAEADGIMRWLVEGCLAWRASGLGDMPEAVRDATDTYLAGEDRLGRWLADRCEVSPNNWNAANDLFDDFSRWCEANHERQESNTWFGTELGKRGFDKKKQGETRGRQGLVLKTSISKPYDFNQAPRQYQHD